MQTVVTWYRDLTRWDIKNYLYLFQSHYPVEKLGKHIYEHSEKENIFDEEDKDFPILGVTNKDGVYLNEYVKGKNINQPYKKVKKGELTYNPYRINVGSIGIVLDEYDGFYISPAYVVFGTKEELLNEYIYIILSADWFNPYLRAATSGSVRQNLTFELLSELKVPVPPLKIQQKIVKQWHNTQKKAEKLRMQIQEKENTIDDYFLSEINVKKKNVDKKRGPFMFRFKYLERWGIEFNSYSWNLDNLFLSKKYDGLPLSKVAKINPTYLFSKDNHEKDISFIPMGAVSDITGRIVQGEKRKLKDVLTGYTKFKEGDIIFAKITPCMENGKCAIAKGLINGIGIGSTEFHVLTPNSSIVDTRYLWSILRLNYFRKSAERYFTGSAGQKRVPDEFLEKIKIPFPPLPKQRQIIDKVDSIRAEISRMRSKSESILEDARQKIGKALLKR